MALIKGADAGSSGRSAIVLDLGDLRRQAEELERGAREQARTILDQARAESRRVQEADRADGRKQGLEEGLAQGIAEGREQGRAEAATEHSEALGMLEKRWEAALGDLERVRDEMIASVREDLLRFASEVASRVAKKIVALDPGSAVAQVEAALSQVVRPTRLVVAVSPPDRELVESALPALVQRLASGAHHELLVDEALSAGSAVVRTEGGSIDASVETQIARIIESVLPERTNESEPEEPA